MQWKKYDDRIVLETVRKTEMGPILHFWAYLNVPSTNFRKNFPFIQSKAGKIQIIFSPDFKPEERGFGFCQ